MAHRIGLTPEDLVAQIRAREALSPSDEADLRLALSLFDVIHHREDVWYSQNHPTTDATEVGRRLQAYLRQAHRIEPTFATERPHFFYTWHPLEQLVLAGQCVWVWYEDPGAAPLLEGALRAVEHTRTPRGDRVMTRGSLHDDILKPHHELWMDPRMVHLNHVWLAEIAEARGDHAAALAHRLTFLHAEPDVDEPQRVRTNGAYYHHKRLLPTSVSVAAEAGRDAMIQGDEALAVRLWTRALDQRVDWCSPAEDLAAWHAAHGRVQEAVDLRRAWLEGMVGRLPAGELGPLVPRFVALAFQERELDPARWPVAARRALAVARQAMRSRPHGAWDAPARWRWQVEALDPLLAATTDDPALHTALLAARFDGALGAFPRGDDAHHAAWRDAVRAYLAACADDPARTDAALAAIEAAVDFSSWRSPLPTAVHEQRDALLALVASVTGRRPVGRDPS